MKGHRAYEETKKERTAEMEILLVFAQFIFWAALIVLIAKYLLVTTLQKFGEALQLKPRVIGTIAGVATSTPEFLTIIFAVAAGFIETGMYNVLSSNIINLLQFLGVTLFLGNFKQLNRRQIKVDFLLVLFSIAIPLFILWRGEVYNLFQVGLFVLLFIVFVAISNWANKHFGDTVDEKLSEQLVPDVEQAKREKGKGLIILRYTSYLLLIAVALFITGQQLTGTLEVLLESFGVPAIVVGAILGVVTSIPEFFTFLEAQRTYDNPQDGVLEGMNNLLTSNLMNLFLIQGTAILLYVLLFG